MAARRLPRRAVFALALISGVGAGTVLAQVVATASSGAPLAGFDPFNPSRMSVVPTRLVPSRGTPTLDRPPIRDPFRPPTRSPFVP